MSASAAQSVSGSLPSGDERRTAELTTGAVCALLGTVVYATAGALHGALTAGTGGARVIFAHVVDHPLWGLINFAILVAGLAWLVVFVVVARSLALSRGPTASGSAFLGQVATVMLTFGLAAATLLYLVDAVVLPNLASAWASSPARQDALVELGNTVQSLIRIPLFHVMPLFILGLPFALMGGALISRHSPFPSWIGWLGAVVGTASFITASLWVVGIDIVPETVMWAVYQPLIWIWVIAVGIVLARRSRTHQYR